MSCWVIGVLKAWVENINNHYHHQQQHHHHHHHHHDHHHNDVHLGGEVAGDPSEPMGESNGERTDSDEVSGEDIA